MTPDEYTKAAIRTENTPNFIFKHRDTHDPIYGTLTKQFKGDLKLSRMMHALLGMMSELGELADAIKKHLIYGASLDEVNLIEELGDGDWYRSLFGDALRVSFEEAWAKNIAKLRARYPDKFTEEKALNRDLEAEREALQRTHVIPFDPSTSIGRLKIALRTAMSLLVDRGFAKPPAEGIAPSNEWALIQTWRQMLTSEPESEHNIQITDLDPFRDADHALEVLRRIAHMLGIDSPRKLRDPANKRIGEMAVSRIDELKSRRFELNRLKENLAKLTKSETY